MQSGYYVQLVLTGYTGYVTDEDGLLYEHVEYFPFGETWVQEATNTERAPYMYTGKEFDEDTKLYYYGARYYDPRTSVWQSVDPILGQYLPTGNKEQDTKLPGMGGVFNSRNLGLYTYTQQNPIKLIDSDGERPLTKGEKVIARKIFGDSINLSKVEIYQEQFAGLIPVPSDRAMAPNGNIYFHPDNPSYSADFSKEGMDLQGLFIHEMAHVWQDQSLESVTLRGIFERDYSYDLSSDKIFNDYGIEGQGNLLMDFFFKKKGHKTSAWGSQSKDSGNTLSGYQKTLKEFIDNPSYLKQRNEEIMKDDMGDDY